MALVDTRFNSYQPNLTVLASNNVIKLGSVVSVVVRSTQSPGKVGVPVTTKNIIGVNSATPTNFGSTTNVSVYIDGASQFQVSNVTYKTFSVSETFVNVMEDVTNLANLNTRIVSSVYVNSGQTVMNVRTVVVEESSRVYGYRTTLPYRNEKILVAAIDRNVDGNRKPTNITERYVFVSDKKTNTKQTGAILPDINVIKSVEVQSTKERKKVGMFETRKAIGIIARKEPISIETKIRPVNVIDDSIAGSGGGGGGGGGGAGVLTEYWS